MRLYLCVVCMWIWRNTIVGRLKTRENSCFCVKNRIARKSFSIRDDFTHCDHILQILIRFFMIITLFKTILIFF